MVSLGKEKLDDIGMDMEYDTKRSMKMVPPLCK